MEPCFVLSGPALGAEIRHAHHYEARQQWRSPKETVSAHIVSILSVPMSRHAWPPCCCLLRWLPCMRLYSSAAGSAQGDAARCGQEPCKQSAPGLTGPTDCRQTRTQELAQQRQHCAVARRDAALWRRLQRRRPRRRRRAARRPQGRPWHGRGEYGGVQRARRAGCTPELIQDVWRARADAKLGKAAMPRMHSRMMCGMHHVESARAQPAKPLLESCTLESTRLYAAPAHMQLSATCLLSRSRVSPYRDTASLSHLSCPVHRSLTHVGQAQNMTGDKLGAHGRQGGPS